MKSNEIRKKFLNDHAEFVIDKYGAFIRGERDEECCLTSLNKMWTLLEKIIVDAKDIDAITAQSAVDVIALLKDGKVDVEVAVKLMELLKTKQDIEELPKLREAIENLNKQS